jgi:hypothetical protein
MPKREEHHGVITDNNDPEKRGRVSVNCPTLVAGDIYEWVEPEFHFVDSSQQAGSFFVPNIGSQIVLSVEAEEDSQVMGLVPRWKCAIYPLDSVPEVFKQNYPNRRGWVTKEGHILYFDDTGDDLQFYYEHPSGTKITVNHDGDIILNTTGSQSVLIGGGATEAIPLGNVLKTLLDDMKTVFDTHSHAAHGAVPVTLFPAVTNAILSDHHKVE